jgi:hypothetical protein
MIFCKENILILMASSPPANDAHFVPEMKKKSIMFLSNNSRLYQMPIYLEHIPVRTCCASKQNDITHG